MSDSYLTLAQKVLEARARPLTARQILSDAERHGLLPSHLSGETMQKTLQARIAEDIFTHRHRSAFYRTRLGTYFLRSLAMDTSLPPRVRDEFEPHTRRQPNPASRVLCARGDVRWSAPQLLLGANNEFLTAAATSYAYLGHNISATYYVLTLTLVKHRDRYFTHTVGKYSHFVGIRGQRTIGLRRYVDEYDVDLFAEDGAGIELSARREFTRVVDRSASDSISNDFRQVATIIDPASLCILLVVVVEIAGESDYDWKTRRRLDITQPAWTPLKNIDSHSLDTPSAMLIPHLRAL